MKKLILYLFFILCDFACIHSQDLINNGGALANEFIQQIGLPGMDDLLNFQNLNKTNSNFVLTQQIGNSNIVSINQQKIAGVESNLSYTIQSGNLNEQTIGQIGTGNVLLGFQLGFVSNLNGNQQGNSITTDPLIFINAQNAIQGQGGEGNGNKMTISQTGNNNSVMAVQQGSENVISAEQTGNNNYLLAYQKGSNNSLEDYKQQNVSYQVLFDKVIQIGDNLSLKSDEVSKSSINGNTFMQIGTNLSFEINSELINSAGGIDVKQTGKDMKVVIDQSYFSFPLK